MQIIITTVIIAVLGVVIGAALVAAGRKFHVEVDEREKKVRDCLPGNNCGGCGFASCDAMAAAIVKGETPVGSCPIGGAPVAKDIAAIMGVEAEVTERKSAFVRCKGSCDVTRNQGNYVGIRDCRSAVQAGLNITECAYGCLGLGSCVKVCAYGAISVRDGLARVDRDKCMACGLCVKACPRGLIELIPQSKAVAVQCMNKDKGPFVRKACTAGCIGCMMCVKACEYGAITVTDNLARVNYELCRQCGKCAEKCPAKVITMKS